MASILRNFLARTYENFRNFSLQQTDLIQVEMLEWLSGSYMYGQASDCQCKQEFIFPSAFCLERYIVYVLIFFKDPQSHFTFFIIIKEK